MRDKKPRVQINYRSGTSMTVECTSFAVTRNKLNGGLSLEWNGANPNPLLMGVDDIESVWEL